MHNTGEDSVDLKVFGDRLRLARERRKISQEALGHLIGKDQRAVSEYEMGRRRVFAEDIPVIAEALKVPVLYFYEDELSVYDLDNELLKHFHKLPSASAKKVAIEYVRLLLHTLQEHAAS